MKKVSFIFLLFFLFLAKPVYGAENGQSIIDRLDTFDFNEISEALNKGLSVEQEKINVKELAASAVKGDLDLSPSRIFNSILRTLFRELFLNGRLMMNLLVVGILGALLKTLTDSFQNKGAGELGFYAGYIVIVMLLFASFRLAVDVSRGLITTLAGIMQASIPLMLGLLVLTGNVTGAAAFHPAMIFAVNIISLVIESFILPAIVFAAILRLVNYMGNRDMLTKLADFAKTSISWVLKSILAVFMLVLSLQRVSAPILNNLALKTARFTVGSLPVVGDLLSGTMDSVLYWSTAAKNGVMVALVVGVIIVCALPLIKIAALFVAFKLTAGVMQPVCDERIIKCIDGVADFIALLVWASVTVVVMFLFALMIILSF